MRLVLDTNIVLDWLLFEDARLSELQRAWDEQRVELVTHMPALEELRRVLTYPQFKLAQSEQTALLECYESRVRIVSLPAGVTLENLGMPAGFPRCKDRDDDHFLALAYHHRADAVVSKDRAVLDLAKRARKFGVTVLGPQQLTAKLTDTSSRLIS
ncbi:putative toxin-antitoxin system toxin component, PIN family [Steroidobacter cummioxidans]|uniref:putative toxin-antitoxin system toxin component, PIN family n=1 Tax=Steroidobacter cummioxidans TaxID=1803913 RepID=UPI0013795713|nr:putative toxin-antitoxin system toxin component, PIN family [Steroidobacter cummioxidans]